jgi:glycine cleavage system H protein
MVCKRVAPAEKFIPMNVPEDREYTHSHEWVNVDGESAIVGITAGDPALAGERPRVELPKTSRAVKAGDVVATIVFANAKRVVRAPLSGSVVAVNRDLESHPELVKEDPYGAGWLFRLEIEAGEEIEHLLDSAVYQEQLRAAEAMDIEVP